MKAQDSHRGTTSGGRKRRRPGGDPVPHKIKKARTTAEMTVEQLAEKAGFQPGQIAKMENLNQPVSLGDLYAIADALGLPASMLLADSHVAPAHIPQAVLPVVSSEVLSSLRDAAIVRLRVEWGGPTVLGPDLGPNAFAFRLNCGCMNRIFPVGALIFVNPADKALEELGRYLVEVGGKLCVRQYRAEPVGRFVPDTTESGHEDLFVDSGAPVRVIGRVRKALIDG